MVNDFKNKDIISIHDFSREDVLFLIEKARELKRMETTGQRYGSKGLLKDKKLVTFFVQDSTRTNKSFKTAMKELGGEVDDLSGRQGSALMKGENLFSTAMMLWANHADAIVMRHPNAGSVQWVADVVGIPVFNGGDGKNEHPTQALLDLFTFDEIYPGIDGLNIGFGGDLAHGRTIRSISLVLSNFKNITIYWAASDELGMPGDLVEILIEKGVKVIRCDSVEDVLRFSNIYYMTRGQKNLIKKYTDAEVEAMMTPYVITAEKLRVNPNVKICHPLPIDKLVGEVDFDVFFSGQQAFFTQAENGIFMRKAILSCVLDKSYNCFNSKVDSNLSKGNNKIYLPVNSSNGKGHYVGKIENGVVIDHLEDGSSFEIEEGLGFVKRGYRATAVPHEYSVRLGKLKDVLKIQEYELSSRDMKTIAMISPDVTFNVIRGGKVVEKFKYRLCSNENCITRVVNEDVPPKFDGDSCHYCRRKI